jgi:hypothetical protein
MERKEEVRFGIKIPCLYSDCCNNITTFIIASQSFAKLGVKNKRGHIEGASKRTFDR